MKYYREDSHYTSSLQALLTYYKYHSNKDQNAIFNLHSILSYLNYVYGPVTETLRLQRLHE
jgi:hypothetical protein